MCISSSRTAVVGPFVQTCPEVRQTAQSQIQADGTGLVSFSDAPSQLRSLVFSTALMECSRTFSCSPLRWRLLAGNEISLIELCSLYRHPCSAPSCTFVNFGMTPFLGHCVSTVKLASIQRILVHPIVQCASNGKCPHDFSHH